MKIKNPFTLSKTYRSSLDYDSLKEVIGKNDTEKILKGLTHRKYASEMSGDEFKIHRYTVGLDMDLFLGNPPEISGKIIDRVNTKIEIQYIPYFWNSIFLIGFSLIFMIGSLLMEKATINGVEKIATFEIRSGFFGIGFFVLLFWYWIDIRPIGHTKSWIEKKLQLTENN